MDNELLHRQTFNIFFLTSDGTPHYFARDYQGSTRAVYTASTTQIAPLAAVTDAGATPQPQYTLEPATVYYPTGLPVDITAAVTGLPAASAATDRLHIGNRWINHAGLGYYDNALGGSSPSEEDKKFDNKMREANYKGTTLLVGGRKEEVTFYYKNKVIAKIPIIILNPLYEN